jgi:hypothetical protein
MQKPFSALAVNEEFTMNGSKYKKIEPVKISCCQAVNCQSVENTSNRTFVQPSTVVEKVDG